MLERVGGDHQVAAGGVDGRHVKVYLFFTSRVSSRVRIGVVAAVRGNVPAAAIACCPPRAAVVGSIYEAVVATSASSVHTTIVLYTR